jgi:probable rRNA maturation factor
VDVELEVEIVEESTAAVEIDLSRVERLIRFILAQAGASGRWAVTVVLTDDPRLQVLHRDFMGIDEPTDVMTFPFEPTDDPVGGEIVVSVERAAAQGPEYGHNAVEEVEFLIAHGLLHLLGWDDAQPNDRAAMLARQTALLAEFARGS